MSTVMATKKHKKNKKECFKKQKHSTKNTFSHH